MEELGEAGEVRITPERNVIQLGGHGAIDDGRSVMYPLNAELGELSRTERLPIVVGGPRSRHLGRGDRPRHADGNVLAELSVTISERNATMISFPLAPWGGSLIHQDDLLALPTLFRLGQLPQSTVRRRHMGSMSIRCGQAAYPSTGRYRARS